MDFLNPHYFHGLIKYCPLHGSPFEPPTPSDPPDPPILDGSHTTGHDVLPTYSAAVTCLPKLSLPKYTM